jgi:hypothetical protein
MVCLDLPEFVLVEDVLLEQGFVKTEAFLLTHFFCTGELFWC